MKLAFTNLTSASAIKDLLSIHADDILFNLKTKTFYVKGEEFAGTDTIIDNDTWRPIKIGSDLLDDKLLSILPGTGITIDTEQVENDIIAKINVNPSAIVMSKAETLATARTLWGNSFNGSANIGGTLVPNANADLGTNSNNFRYAYISWLGSKSNSNLDIAASNQSSHIRITTAGNIGIGTTNPAEKLTVSGRTLISYDDKNALVIGSGATNISSNIYTPTTGIQLTNTGNVVFGIGFHRNNIDSSVILNSLNTDKTLSIFEFKSDRSNGALVKANSFVKVGGTSTLFLKADGSVDSNTYLTAHQSLANYVTLNGTLTITGQKNFNTNMDASPLIISREGKDTEAVKISVNDSLLTFNYINDETSSSIRFILNNTDTENSNGTKASTRTITMNNSGSITGTTSIEGNADSASALANTFAARQTSMDRNYGDGTLRYYMATSTTTTGKPPMDAKILHCSWDNVGGWDSQLAITASDNARLYTRGLNGDKTKWGAWKTIAFTSDLTWTNITNTPTTISGYGITDATNYTTVTLHTSNDVNYPIVWSNLSNTNSNTSNLLYKSHSDLYYNPKNKKLYTGGSVATVKVVASSDAQIGSCDIVYDSTNKCLNFNFI